MERIFNYKLGVNTFLYRLLAFFAILCLVGGIFSFSFRYRNSAINNEMLFFGGLALFGLCLIVIVISKIKSMQSARNMNSLKLTKSTMEISKGAHDIIKVQYSAILSVQLLENKFRGDVLSIKYKNTSNSVIYIDSRGFNSLEEFYEFQHLIEGYSKK